MLSLEDLWYLKYGGRKDLWVHDVPLVGDFIKRHRLAPIAKADLAAHTHVLDVPVATQAHTGAVPRIGYAGGIRAPHLHHNGEIYSLDRAQWREFAEHTLNTLRDRLNDVKTVGFEQLMDLSEVVNSVA